MKLPKTLGACVDLLYKTRQERLEIQRSVEEFKAQEAAIEEHIINTFTKTELKGAKGELATVSLKETVVPTVTDWDKLWPYVSKNKAWDLLQKRASTEAFRERWDAGKTIPGVEQFVKISLSITKR